MKHLKQHWFHTQTNVNSSPVMTATIPYIRGTSKPIARILQPYNKCVAHKPITTLQQLLTNVKGKDKPDKEQYTKSNAATAKLLNYIGETGRNLSTWLTEHKRAMRNGDVNNHIAEHHLQTNIKSTGTPPGTLWRVLHILQTTINDSL